MDLPVPCSPARRVRAERQVMFVFVPTESLRRVCIVPLELIAGILAMVELALRTLPGSGPSTSSVDYEQRQASAHLAVTHQPEQSPASPRQSSPADSSDLHPQQGCSSGSSRRSSEVCTLADDTPTSSSSVDQDHEDVALSAIEVSEQNRLNEERANAGMQGDELSKETFPEYGPFWPCSVHPPNQALRFCDLTEEEQEEIMDADLEAYRMAWRPGDMKHILWNPDPEVADEDQGQEAFHDENYEFFWWTPTAYPTTKEKYVFYSGNVTKYPVHGPVYCPTCDRHVWEALPKKAERLNTEKQFGTALLGSGQDSFPTEPTQTIPVITEHTQSSVMDYRFSQSTEQWGLAQTLIREGDSSQGGGFPWHSPCCSLQTGSLPYPERTSEDTKQASIPCVQRRDISDPQEEPIYWTPGLDPTQFGLQFAHGGFVWPPCCAVTDADNRQMDCSEDKAVQTVPIDSVESPECGPGSSDQGQVVHPAYDQNEQKAVMRVAVRLQQLCIATLPSSEGRALGDAGQEQPTHAARLERMLLELIEKYGSEECRSIVCDGTSDVRGSQNTCEDAEECKEKVHPTVLSIGNQDVQHRGDSGRHVEEDVVTKSAKNQGASKAKNQAAAGSSRKRRNRRSRKLAQLKSDGFLDPKPGPSGRCGCKCEACRGCTGSSQPKDADKVRVECKQQHGQVPGTFFSFQASRHQDKELKDSGGAHMQHEKTRCMGESNKICLSENADENGVADVLASSSSEAKSHFIDISFGECEPIRIYKQTQLQTSLPVRPFYEPQDRSMTHGMDVALGDGCMGRLMASGLDMDDFIITEGSGRHSKKMFLWPGPPTKPCVDLVGQRNNLTRFRVPTLPTTIPTARSTCLDERNCNMKDSEDIKTCKDGAQMVDTERIGKESSQSSSRSNGNDKETHVVWNQTGKRNLSEESSNSVPSSSIPSHAETTDAEPVSPHSSEDEKRTPNKTKRFRWTMNKIWKKKDLSTDPSSPYSTFESGSLSSDEAQQKRKLQSLRTPDNIMSSNEHPTGATNNAIAQEKSNAHISRKHVSVPAEDQLRIETITMETRRHRREVRRAKRTVQHLRLVRRSYLRTAKLLRPLKVARQAGVRRPLRKNRTKRFQCATDRNLSELASVPAESTPGTCARSFHQQLASTFGPAPHSPQLSRPTSTPREPMTRRAAVAVNAANIVDVCSTVTRIAEGTSVREVEVELLSKASPTPVRQKLETNIEQRTFDEGHLLASQAEASVQCNETQKEISEHAPLSPHSKADGLWNGRRPEDFSGIGNSSSETSAQNGKATTGQPDTAQHDGRASPSRSSMFDCLSYHDICDEMDFVRDFEESELGKLMAISAELETLEQGDSSHATESQTVETDTGNADHETCAGPACDEEYPADMENLRHLSLPSRSPQLDSLVWDPIWVQSPPLSPRSRLWAIFSRLPGGQNAQQPQHASTSELLPGAAEDTAVYAEQTAVEQASNAGLRSATATAWGPDGPALALRPALLITSAHLQPEDNLLAHGDPARPWVRCHSRGEAKTLADLIVGHRSRPGLAANGTFRR